MLPRISSCIVVLLFSVLCGGVCQATDYTWVGGDPTNASDWSTPGNWSPVGVPSTGDKAFIGISKTVTLSSDFTVDTVTLDSGSILSGLGTLTVSSSFRATDATLDGSGMLNLDSNCDAEFDSLTPPNSSKKNTSQKRINNKGKAYLKSGDLILTADFVNATGAAFYADSDGAISWTGPRKPRFTNNGNFIKSNGAGTSYVLAEFDNTGSVIARTGTLDLGPNFTQTAGLTTLAGGQITSDSPLQFSGGLVNGTGIIQGDVNNSGAHIAPGHSPGSITILGNFTQTAGGSLDMQIAGVDPGTQYDQIVVQGTATLAGTLNISWLNGYQPNLGDAYTLLEYLSCTGNFSTVKGTILANKHYLATSVTPSYYLATANLDSQAPTASINSPSGGLWTGQFPVTGVAGDSGSGVSQVTMRLYRAATSSTPAGYWNGTSWDLDYNSATDERKVTGLNSWSFTTPRLASGKYSARATATDAVQNVGSSASVSFQVDNTVPPTLAFSAPLPGAYLTKLPPVKGTAADDTDGSGLAHVDLYLRRVATNTYWTGSSWGAKTVLPASLSLGTWSYSSLPSGSNLPDGTYELTAQAFDKAGLSKSLVATVTVDATPPTGLIKTPLFGNVVTTLPSAAGTASDNFSGLASLTLRLARSSASGVAAGYWNGTAWDTSYDPVKDELPVTGTTSWSRALLSTASLADTKYNIRLTIKDKCGNTSTASTDLWVDSAPPANITIDTPADGSYVTKLPSVAGVAADAPGGQGIARVDLQLRRVKDSLYWNGTGWQTAAVQLKTSLSGTSWNRGGSTYPLPSGSNLLDGAYALTATAYDKALGSKVATSSITVDASLPKVTVTSPLNSSSYPQLTTVQGTASDTTSGVLRVSVRLYRYSSSAGAAGYWNGSNSWTSSYSAAVNEITATGTTAWSLALPTLSEGRYYAIATAYDKSGNKVSSTTISFSLDGTLPSVSIVSPMAGAQVKTLPPLNGKASDALSGISKITLQLQRPDGLFWNGSAWLASANLTAGYTSSSATWSYGGILPSGTNLPEGPYNLTVTAQDKAGNVAAVSSTLTVDKTVPQIALLSPGATAYQSLAQVAGTATDDVQLATVTVRLSRSAWAGTPAGYWNGTSWDSTYNATVDEVPAEGLEDWLLALPPLADGKYTARATAKDGAGNSASTPGVNFTVDSTAPETLTITNPADGSSLTSLSSFTGTAKDSLSGVSDVSFSLKGPEGLYWTGTAWGAETPLATSLTSAGVWTSSSPLPSAGSLPSGTYVLKVQATDRAGNVATTESQFNLTPASAASIKSW